MDIDAAIRAELRRAIKRRKLTQAQAAARMGTSAKHLSQVLSGASHASITTLVKWSTRLGITWEVKAVDLIDNSLP